MLIHQWLIIACTFAATSAVICLLWSLSRGYESRVAARLDGLGQSSASQSESGLVARLLLNTGSSRLASKLLPRTENERNQAQQRLMQAGIYHPQAVEIYYFAKLSAMLLPPLLVLAIGKATGQPLNLLFLAGGLLGCVGTLLPSLVVDRLISRRHITLRQSLPDFMDLTVVCLEAGLSVNGTLQRVSDELRIAHPVLTNELTAVQRDIELGAPIHSAFRRFADRSGLDSVRLLAAFVKESQKMGTQLATALRTHSEMMRAQREERAVDHAQKASMKILLPTFALIFPTVLVVFAGPAIIQIQETFGL